MYVEKNLCENGEPLRGQDLQAVPKVLDLGVMRTEHSVSGISGNLSSIRLGMTRLPDSPVLRRVAA